MFYNKTKALMITLYEYSIILSLALFFFANDDIIGLGGFFYIPTIIAFVTGFFIKTKLSKIDYVFFIFLFFSFLSTIIYYNSSVSVIMQPITRLFIGYFSFRHIRILDLKKIISIFSWLSFIILIAHYVFSDLNQYRYGGFYGDPNYLAMSFSIIMVMNMMNIHICSSYILRIISIINIILIIPLIIFGISRAGIVSVCIILIFYLIFLLKTRRNYGILLSIILFLFSGSFFNLFAENINNIINWGY